MNKAQKKLRSEIAKSLTDITSDLNEAKDTTDVEYIANRLFHQIKMLVSLGAHLTMEMIREVEKQAERSEHSFLHEFEVPNNDEEKH